MNMEDAREWPLNQRKPLMTVTVLDVFVKIWTHTYLSMIHD